MEILINFDEVIDRKGTYCTQWDYVQDRFGKADLLPFTISDTDFAVPPSVNEAIQKRIQHPFMVTPGGTTLILSKPRSIGFKSALDCG